MKIKYKYIHFEKLGEYGKHSQYACYNNKSNGMLGGISYYIKWRQFVFYPQADTIFNSSCLLDIVDFLDQLNGKKKKINPPPVLAAAMTLVEMDKKL